MDISLDLTSVGVALVGAVSAIGGVVAGPLVNSRADRTRQDAHAAQANWLSRRDAYVDLLAQATTAEAAGP